MNINRGRVSVCMTTYNGEKYLQEQIGSILIQLKDCDELIISDDGSTDKTIQIIKQFNSPCIRFYQNHFRNHILNFEFVLSKAIGDYIFLSDQDDVWTKDKLEIMLEYLQRYDLICSDCFVVDKGLNSIKESFYNNSCDKRTGLLKNLFHNHYLGCCMAFKKNILDIALPFPKNVMTHDMWIGLVAEVISSTVFINDKLIYFRRHGNNTSNTLNGSSLSFYEKIKYRVIILIGLVNNILLKKNVRK